MITKLRSAICRCSWLKIIESVQNQRCKNALQEKLMIFPTVRYLWRVTKFIKAADRQIPGLLKGLLTCSYMPIFIAVVKMHQSQSMTFKNRPFPPFAPQTVMSSSQLLAPTESRCWHEKSSSHTRSLTFAEDESLSSFMLNLVTEVLPAGRRQFSWPDAKEHLCSGMFDLLSRQFLILWLRSV